MRTQRTGPEWGMRRETLIRDTLGRLKLTQLIDSLCFCCLSCLCVLSYIVPIASSPELLTSYSVILNWLPIQSSLFFISDVFVISTSSTF